jgi:hypothetical protein
MSKAKRTCFLLCLSFERNRRYVHRACLSLQSNQRQASHVSDYSFKKSKIGLMTSLRLDGVHSSPRTTGPCAATTTLAPPALVQLALLHAADQVQHEWWRRRGRRGTCASRVGWPSSSHCLLPQIQTPAATSTSDPCTQHPCIGDPRS